MTLRILVLGATGHTGTHIIDLALARGHKVTAYVRSPHKITRRDPGLTVVQGSLQAPELARALPGHDAVLSTLGRSVRETLRPSTFMAESAATTVAAMEMAGVRRLGILSAAVLFPGEGLGYAFFRWLLRHHSRDLLAMEAVVQATPFDWTIARPPRLTKTPDERYRSRRHGLPDGASTATFRGVAAFLLDSLEQENHRREIVGLVGGAGGA